MLAHCSAVISFTGARQSCFDRISDGVWCRRNFFLQDGPDRVIHWVEILLVWRSNILAPKSLEKLKNLFGRIRWSPILLKHESIRAGMLRRPRFQNITEDALPKKTGSFFLVAQTPAHTMTAVGKQLRPIVFAVTVFCWPFLSSWWRFW